MKRLRELIGYVLPYKANLAVNIICNILNAFLSLFTFLSVVPFLRILFGGDAADAARACNLRCMAVSPRRYSTCYWCCEVAH